MQCVICFEDIKHLGFQCIVCIDGAICDCCYYNNFLNQYPLITLITSMFKVINCPICRTECVEIFVDN